MVRAKVNGIERGFVLFKQTFQACVNRLEVFKSQESPSNSGLVRDHHQPGSCRFQTRQSRTDSRKQFHICR